MNHVGHFLDPQKLRCIVPITVALMGIAWFFELVLARNGRFPFGPHGPDIAARQRPRSLPVRIRGIFLLQRKILVVASQNVSASATRPKALISDTERGSNEPVHGEGSLEPLSAHRVCRAR